jgi:adenosylcobinamide amidohydrolase
MVEQKIDCEKKIGLSLNDVTAKIVYHTYNGFKMNTMLVGFKSKRRIISTLDGYDEVYHVGNVYVPLLLSQHTMKNYKQFKRGLPLALGVRPRLISFLSTGVDMDQLAICERSYENLHVCCLATAGAKGNALRTGVDIGNYVEYNGNFRPVNGTINIILLTNSTLSDGAMARAIVTVTEAKAAALQDLDVRSTYLPSYLATGTGTDNVIVVSGKVGKPLTLTSGHTKIGELIGSAAKTAVTDALKKHGDILN